MFERRKQEDRRPDGDVNSARLHDGDVVESRFEGADVGKGPFDGGGGSEIGEGDGGVVYVPTGDALALALALALGLVPHVAQELLVVCHCGVVDEARIKGLHRIHVPCSHVQWMGRVLRCFHRDVITEYVGVVSSCDDGGSDCSGRPMRIRRFQEQNQGAHMGASHGRAGLEIPFHRPIVHAIPGRRRLGRPRCQYVYSRRTDVRL